MSEEAQRATQSDEIMAYMRTNGSITQFQALFDLGCMRLAARISELRNTHSISTEMIEVTGKHNGKKCKVAKYRIIEAPPNDLFPHLGNCNNT